MTVKLDASMALPPRAKRQKPELAAKAVSANTVQIMILASAPIAFPVQSIPEKILRGKANQQA
jgi:hypothetical protein